MLIAIKNPPDPVVVSNIPPYAVVVLAFGSKIYSTTITTSKIRAIQLLSS